MINYQDFEKLLRERDYLEKTGAVHGALRKQMEIPGVNQLAEELADETDKETIFARIRSFSTIDKIREILTIERDAFLGTNTFSSTMQGNSDLSQSFLLLSRSHRYLTLLTSIDPYMLRVNKSLHPDVEKNVNFASGNSEVFILKGAIRYRVWEVDPFDDSTDMASYEPNMRVGEPRLLEAGEVLREGDFMSVEYLPHDEPTLLVHTQMMSGTAPLDISCSLTSRTLVRVAAPESRLSRYQMIATLMRILERDDAFDLVATLLAEPYHFLRWHGMRELIGLDAERALPLLQKMAETDPQPAVRRAAQLTLDEFFTVPAKAIA